MLFHIFLCENLSYQLIYKSAADVCSKAHANVQTPCLGVRLGPTESRGREQDTPSRS